MRVHASRTKALLCTRSACAPLLCLAGLFWSFQGICASFGYFTRRLLGHSDVCEHLVVSVLLPVALYGTRFPAPS